MRRSKVAAAVALGLLLPSCTIAPPYRVPVHGTIVPPRIALEADGQAATTRLSVLTYNVEGLGWPARSGRSGDLREIGERLNQLRNTGDGPDVILFQEVFSSAARRAIVATGYPAIVSGPRRTTAPPPDPTATRLPGRAKLKHGEIGIHFVGSGLVIASRYPVVETRLRAFGRRSCAGLDCLSNKGIMLARIAIPGVPVPVDLYNTHMNSRGASHAPSERHRPAHARQSREIADFIRQTRNAKAALIFGGDFNMKHSELRWANFSSRSNLKLVHEVCTKPPHRCDVRLSWDGDAPWMDTQDLQFFAGGEDVTLTPTRVEALFDGGPSGPALSDHDGFQVAYELRWATNPSAGMTRSSR